MEDRLRQAHALPVALGQLADRPVVHALDARRSHGRVEPLLPHGTRELAQVGDEGEVVGDEHVTVQRVVLGEVADAAFRLARGVGHGDAVQADGPGVRLDVLGDHAHRGGLAGAVGAEEAHHLAAVDREGRLVHRDDAVKPFGNALEAQEGHSGRW